jgi:hypothetical protein
MALQNFFERRLSGPNKLRTTCLADHLRLLGRGCIVQLNQRLSVNPLPKYGEVTVDLIHIHVKLNTGVA